MADGMHRAHSNLPESSRWQPMAQEETRMTRKGGERVMRRSMRKQHYNSTPQKELAMIMYISRMRISLPNILAITGGVSSRQKEGNDISQFGARQTIALQYAEKLESHSAPLQTKTRNTWRPVRRTVCVCVCAKNTLFLQSYFFRKGLR